MKPPDRWLGKRYHTMNAYFRNRFGCKALRVSVDAGFTCPNRDGVKSFGGCIYCNQTGSRAHYVQPELSVSRQIEEGKNRFRRKESDAKYLVYFQPYTNTYADIATLRSVYRQALETDCIGISVGTRPDCLSEPVLDLLEEIAQTHFVLLELGVQTMDNDTMARLNRHHSTEESLSAIRAAKARKGIITLAHLILGLPDESQSSQIEGVRRVVESGIDAVKFHHFYIEKDTAAEKLYAEGKIAPPEREAILETLATVIPCLPQNIAIHRLFGQSRAQDLVAPQWTLEKMKNIELLDRLLEERDLCQGQNAV